MTTGDVSLRRLTTRRDSISGRRALGNFPRNINEGEGEEEEEV